MATAQHRVVVVLAVRLTLLFWLERQQPVVAE
jgi:hypothetical protein